MKKRKIALFMAMLMCMSVTPAYAAVEETQELNTAETAEATVYADIDSVYTVTLPKTIKLDSADKNSDYSVNVKGDIAGTKIASKIIIPIMIAPTTEDLFLQKRRKASLIKVVGFVSNSLSKIFVWFCTKLKSAFFKVNSEPFAAWTLGAIIVSPPF